MSINLALRIRRLLKTGGEKHMAHYPEKIRRIKEALMELSSLEKQGETDVDRVAGCSGRIMEEVFAFRKDVWDLHCGGWDFISGSFIYILDAYDDLEEDRKTGSYNPLKYLQNNCKTREAYEKDRT